jgi:tetratricopeptide (TPR) repeat protein
MRRRSRWLASFLFSALCLQGVASADVDRQLAAYETEARALGTDLPQPNQLTGAAGQRRLVDAEVAFALGDYDTSALMLFDLASKPGTDQETATYYLAESLFQKHDRGAARSYYEQIVASNNLSSRYYQPSLLRLIEIAIAQRDTTNVATHIAALDRVSAGLKLPEVPYVRGKFAFFEGKLDEALAFFQQVPKGSKFELQALYYTGTTQVAKKDLGKATEIFTDLIARKPSSPNDRRVMELSQLALGRLFYERDQPSKSIDSYLLVDRHSDLFPDALYEVAWVYVKGKQYDKALRALELLAVGAELEQHADRPDPRGQPADPQGADGPQRADQRHARRELQGRRSRHRVRQGRPGLHRHARSLHAVVHGAVADGRWRRRSRALPRSDRGSLVARVPDRRADPRGRRAVPA